MSDRAKKKKIANALYPNWYSKGPLNKLGEGANGEVWRVGNKVMKIIKKFNPVKSKREFNFQKNAGNHGIAPKVRGNLKNFGNKTGAYLMNSLPKNTLTQMAYNAKKNNYPNYNAEGSGGNRNRMLTNAIVRLHRNARIHHGDLHRQNIMFTINPITGKILKVWVIDYGRSSRIPVGQTASNVQAAFVDPKEYPGYPHNLWKFHSNTSAAATENLKRHIHLKIKENNLRHPHNRRTPRTTTPKKQPKQRKGLFNFN
jgi:tRNA A-37 threonylcarbamoyl transferase component Bud32